jgi:hypothetical protein
MQCQRLNIILTVVITLLCLVLHPSLLYADTTGEASVNPRLVRMGTTFSVTLTITTDQQIQPMQPAFPTPDGVTLTNPLANQGTVLHAMGSNVDAVHTFTAEYLADEAGIYQIGPFRVSYRDGAGVTQELTIDPVTVEVYEDAPRPASDIFHSMAPWWLKYVLIAFLLAVLGALFVAWYAIRKRRKPSVAAPTPLRPFAKSPEQVTYEKIRDLPVPDAGDAIAVKTYYDSVDEILRGYLGTRYEVSTHDMTAWEIRREFNRRKRLDSRVKGIFVLINDCDWVKYAKTRPGKDDIEKVVPRAGDVLLGTSNPEEEANQSV